jgi:hypothetical protein
VPGCCGCVETVSGQVCFTVRGCPDFAPIVQAGATIAVTKAGVAVGSVVTNSSGQGCVTLTGFGTGTYSYTIELAPYDTFSGTFTWFGATTNIARTLTYDSANYLCLCQGSDLVAASSTLYLSDGAHTIPITSGVGCRVYDSIPNCRLPDGTIGTGSVPVQFNTDLTSCALSVAWQIDNDGSGRPRAGPCPLVPSACNVTVPRTSISSSPVLVVFTYSGGTGLPCGQPIPPFPSGATFSLSP